jgi:hypothetical protein
MGDGMQGSRMRLVGLAFGVSLALSGCMGSTRSVTADAGKSTVIGGGFSYDPRTCRTGEIPRATVAIPPAQGSVRIERRNDLMGSQTDCSTMRAGGVVYIYTPRPGFRGRDSLSIRSNVLIGISGGQRQDSTTTYEIEVK